MDESARVEKFPIASGMWVGYLLGALGSSMFATKGIFIKLALIEHIDAVTTLTWRMNIATPIFVLVGWLGYRHQKSMNPDFQLRWVHVGKAALVGILGYYIAAYLDFQGLQYVTAQFDRLILMTYPFFVVIIGAVSFGRPVSRSMIGALLLAYIGLAVIFSHDLRVEGDNVIIGSALVLGAALSYAFHQTFAKPVIDEIGSRLFTSIAMSAAGVAVVIHFALTHPLSDIDVGADAVWMMFAIGTVTTVLPAYLIAAAIGRIGPAATSIIGNVSPLVTIFLAVTVLGEAFSVYHAIGALMVILGILFFTRAERRAAQIAAADRVAVKL